MTYDLTRVHEANLYMLKEIDRICKKYGINYMLDAGTLLGAVRHKGFIPWDDDADVAMTRENYEKFARVAKKELPSDLEFLEPQVLGGGKAFYDFNVRVLYLNSRTRQDDSEMEYYSNKLTHLWVDIFILDELPDSKLSRTLTLLGMKVIYGFAMGHRYSMDYSKYSLLQKCYVGVLATVGKCLPMKTIYRLQHSLSIKHNTGKNHCFYYTNYPPDYFYVTLNREWCDNIITLELEGEQFMCSAQWDDVLRWIYGDYRKLPPEEMRVPTHSNIEIEVGEAGEQQ